MRHFHQVHAGRQHHADAGRRQAQEGAATTQALLRTGVGFGLYGQLERHELYYVVAAIWILQLAWSPWWLARHHYGPAEWLWRSLTYRAWQPLAKAPGAAAPLA